MNAIEKTHMRHSALSLIMAKYAFTLKFVVCAVQLPQLLLFVYIPSQMH